MTSFAPIKVGYKDSNALGVFSRSESLSVGVWIRLRAACLKADEECKLGEKHISLAWPSLLCVIREFSGLQRSLGFRFEADDSSREKIKRFVQEFRIVETSRGGLGLIINQEQINPKLVENGWDLKKRDLKSYQKANLCRLLSLPHGANFSVPGAGKTTVTFALHLLLRSPATKFLVVAPKNAFPAWKEVVDECIGDGASREIAETFTVLTDGIDNVGTLLRTNASRFLISYDQLIRVEGIIGDYLARNAVHLVIDESHRMKAGHLSQRGGVLLNLCHLAVRRDILSGTPMPQAPADIQSQLDFLWPGSGLGDRIARGELPRLVLGNLYVRTTKTDLELPARKTTFVPVVMDEAHKALYCIVRDEFRRQVSELRARHVFDILKARRSVIRLLQVSSNPVVALDSFVDTNDPKNLPRLLEAVIAEGPSTKIRKAVELAHLFAREGKKTIIWTIFTDTIYRLSHLLAGVNPVVIYGQVPAGDVEDEDTREGRLERFRQDPKCSVLIANPAAASEGISLHMHCHDAIYVDRSYSATHFLQSIDRIHRLGLPRDIETRIWILQNQAPVGIGSIDYSVSRRLAKKIREMQKLLDDPDLNQLALDEESAPLPLEDGVDLQDIDDLITEIEGRPSANEDELA